MANALNSLGRSTGRRFNMAAIKREFQSIDKMRDVIEAAQWNNLDLQGHTREEFMRRNVPAVMVPHIAALDALVIAPRYARDLERCATVRANCERRIERWNELHGAALLAMPAVSDARPLPKCERCGKPRPMSEDLCFPCAKVEGIA